MPFHVEMGQDTPRASDNSEALATSPSPAPILSITIYPHQSLTPEGFVWFVGATAALISVPLFGILGTSVFWALLPFLIAAIWAVWVALKRSWRDRSLRETLRLWPDRMEVHRHEADGTTRSWKANPYWVRTSLHADTGPVPHYLTLKGEGREIELGACLTPSERQALKQTIDRHLPR